MRVLCRLLRHRQLQHGGALALAEQGNQHMGPIGKFDRIVVAMRDIRIDRAEFSHPRIDLPGPYPSVVVSDVLGECQFGSGKHADGDAGIACGSETARRSSAERGGNQRLANSGGARRYGVQAIVTHRVAPRSR